MNGQPRSFEPTNDSPSVQWLLETLGMAERRVAVELNRRIVKRATYAETSINDGDVVEIVHFVGGG